MASGLEDSQLYMEENVEGKGTGCFANRDIKKGDLVLREAPQLLHPVLPETTTSEELVKHYIFCVLKYMEMSEEDQKSYLELVNKFEADERTWFGDMQLRYLDLQRIAKDISEIVEDISQEKAFVVMAIMETNGFHNGVCLKMSRFNHSCRPNAQYFWNKDRDTRDVRTLRKIKQGEEITVSYITIGRGQLFGREERRSLIKDTYHFDCKCKTCDLADEEVEQEMKRLDEYMEEMQKKKRFHDSAKTATYVRTGQALRQSELGCLKKLYRIAKEIKTFNRRFILRDIVEEAFDVSVQGALSAATSLNMGSAKMAWMKDAKNFADIGLEIAKTLNGPDHSETKAWRERSEDPIKFFLKEFGGTVNRVAVA